MILLTNAVKNYRSASLLACKQELLLFCSHERKWAIVKVRVGGVKSKGSGQSRVRWVKLRAAESRGGKCECGQRLSCLRPGSQKAKRTKSAKLRVLCSEDLHSW